MTFFPISPLLVPSQSPLCCALCCSLHSLSQIKLRNLMLKCLSLRCCFPAAALLLGGTYVPICIWSSKNKNEFCLRAKSHSDKDDDDDDHDKETHRINANHPKLDSDHILLAQWEKWMETFSCSIVDVCVPNYFISVNTGQLHIWADGIVLELFVVANRVTVA